MQQINGEATERLTPVYGKIMVLPQQGLQFAEFLRL